MILTIRLLKPAKATVITYQGTLLQRDATHMLLHARWEHPLVDLGCVTFAPGDQLYEHFYSDRWYNVYELHTSENRLKGWYCNLSRPAVFHTDMIESEDLELDLFVSPDRRTIQVLDTEEYAARRFETTDPAAHRAVMQALAELRALAAQGTGPFASGVLW